MNHTTTGTPSKFLAILFCVLSMLSRLGFEGRHAQAQQVKSRNRTPGTIVPNRDMKFEVISIHPMKPGWSPYNGAPAVLSNTQPSPVGFSSTLTVWQMMMIAYAPNDRAWPSVPLEGLPSWTRDGDWYVIHAHVSESDVNTWRNQSNQHELLRSAMRDLLRTRCRLAVRLLPALLPDYKLVIAKSGLKMKPSVQGAELPKGEKLPTGAVRVSDSSKGRLTWHYYGATVEELVDFLGMSSVHVPIHDETGITGRYDFNLQMVENPTRDSYEQIYNWPVTPLGLELKQGKNPGFKLVVDHLEKPSLND